MRGAWLASVLFLLLAPGSAFAERRVALVIGIDEYETIRPLSGAVNDARAMEGALEALGFEVFSETDRNLKRMRRALQDFREDGAGADVALVFFAGHGVEIGGENRLLPADADAASPDALRDTSLPLEEVREAVNAIAPVGLIVLDACRNDPFGSASAEGRGASSLKASLPETVKPGLGRLGRAENVLFAFAAAPGATASDGSGGNSPFTAALKKYLATDGIEIRSVFTLVQQEVYDRSRGGQLPYVENGLPALFFASKTAGELPERERLLLAMADVTPSLRDEVERIATDHDMPLAPLYGALLGGDTSVLGDEAPGQRLEAAADAYAQAREDLRNFAPGDPEVALLHEAAAQLLAEGSREAALAKFSEARSLDRKAREALKDRMARDRADFNARTLSEAGTAYLEGAGEAAFGRLAAATEKYQAGLAVLADLADADAGPEALRLEARLLTASAAADIARGAVGEAIGTVEALKALAARGHDRDADKDHWNAELARAHELTARTWVYLGMADGAIAELQAARAILSSLSQARPLETAWLYRLADVLGLVAELSETQGLLGDALAANVQKGEAIAAMIERGGASDTLLWQLAMAYLGTGELQFRLWQYDLAERSYRAALGIRQGFFDADPGNLDTRFELGAARERTGDSMLARGDFDGAEAAYRERHEGIIALSGAFPENMELKRDLSVSLEKLGDVARGRGKLDEALGVYRRAAVIMDEILTAAPDNAAWRYDALIAQRKIGEVILQQGQHVTALTILEASLNAARTLASEDAANRSWQAELAVHHMRVGEALLALGRGEEALAHNKATLDIMLALTSGAPPEPTYLANLAVAHRRVAAGGEKPVEHLRAAIQILEAMERQGFVSIHDPTALADTRRQLEEASKKG